MLYELNIVNINIFYFFRNNFTLWVFYKGKVAKVLLSSLILPKSSTLVREGKTHNQSQFKKVELIFRKWYRYKMPHEVR